jgi:8-oxo-dGTP diphosphatase
MRPRPTEAIPDKRCVEVCAGVLLRDRQLLLARRPSGTHLAGAWEFPGGKVLDNESLAHCLAREIHEELGINITVRQELLTLDHSYPEKNVRLHFLLATVEYGAAPHGHDGQEWRWIELDALAEFCHELAPADARFAPWLLANRNTLADVDNRPEP